MDLTGGRGYNRIVLAKDSRQRKRDKSCLGDWPEHNLGGFRVFGADFFNDFCPSTCLRQAGKLRG